MERRIAEISLKGEERPGSQERALVDPNTPPPPAEDEVGCLAVIDSQNMRQQLRKENMDLKKSLRHMKVFFAGSQKILRDSLMAEGNDITEEDEGDPHQLD
jgi:hypothetical protein